MKLLAAQLNADALAELGSDAVQLLCRGDVDTMARRYGYALSFGREPATAIREDLRGCLAEIGASSLVTAPEVPVPRVGFFPQPDSSNLVALVECRALADNGATVLVELIVTTDGTAQYITLEDLTAA